MNFAIMTRSIHILCIVATGAGSFLFAQSDVITIRETFIPKRETGALQFIQDHPSWDGRNTVIAVFDSGVDPAALDLQTTTTGERKVLDVIDASGSGDVDMNRVEDWPSDNGLIGLTGRELTLPELNPADGKIRLGVKRADALFNRRVLNRIRDHRQAAWEARLTQLKREQQLEREAAEAAGDFDFEDRPENEWTLAQQNLVAKERLLEDLQESYRDDAANFVFDCVLWFDGAHYRVLVDTDADGDLVEETVLRPFGIAGEYGRFDDTVSSTFAVQVYEEGRTLSLVTVSGSHGTHVASIAAGHRPDEPSRNGIAPGAQILSIKIGDIRTQGSSNLFAETRALAQAAAYGVDVINLSWGGGSRRMDGGELYARLFGDFTLDYNIPIVASAGNNGPALSTLGSPGGESSPIIGVGAWFSTDMAKYVYAYVDEKENRMYSFSSTGPGKDGDLGPDIIAPGGAIASVAIDELQGQDRYHGTSMSAPSAAGVVSLLVSAAKATNTPVNPYLIRSALMNSAQPQAELEPWSQGAGLIQTSAAWDRLKSYSQQPSFQYHYNIRVEGNTFEDGEGIYIRGNEPILENQFFITVRPVFPDGISPEAKVGFFEEIELRTDADWIRLPAVLPLSGSGEGFTPVIHDPGELGVSETHFAWIEGVSLRFPEAGPLFRIPVTLVRGLPLVAGEGHTFDVVLKSQSLVRHFFEIPADQQNLHLHVERTDDDPNAASYYIQTLSPSRVDDAVGRSYFTLEPDGEDSFVLPVIPGSTVEVVFNQTRFSRNNPTTLRVQAKTSGFVVRGSPPFLAQGDTRASFQLTSPGQDFSGSIKAAINTAHHRLLPEEAELFIPDERSLFPANRERPEARNIYGLKLSYSIELEEASKAEVSIVPGVDISQGLSWVIFLARHESGKVLARGIRDDLNLPKGKSTFLLFLYAKEEANLEALDTLPIQLETSVGPVALQVFEDHRDFFLGGPKGEVNLLADREYDLLISADSLEALHEVKPAPSYFQGELEMKQDDSTLRSLPVVLILGEATEEDEKKKPTIKAEDERSPQEKLEDALLETQLKFVESRLNSSDPVEQRAGSEVLESLVTEHADDAEVLLTQARFQATHSGLLLEREASEEDEEKTEDGEAAAEPDSDDESVEPLEPVDLETVLAQILQARLVLDEAAVALFFATAVKPEAEEEKALKAFLKTEKEMKEKQALLMDSYLLESELYLQDGRFRESRETLAKAEHFGSPDEAATQRLSQAALEKQGLHALAIEAINEQLKDDPYDASLLKERIELYRQLGWDQFADHDELHMQLRKTTKP